MALTLDDALDSLGAKFCGQCAAKLPVAGDQCPACGALPAVTRAELAEALAEPGALARAEADELRAKAAGLRDEMMTTLRAADRVLHLASLRNARDRAQSALEAAHDRQRHAEGVLGEAKGAVDAAAPPLQEAYGNHHKAEQDEEAARRLGKGPTAEKDALRELDAATQVLARYQAPMQEALAAQEAAEALTGTAAADVKAAEEVRDAAAWGCEHPGYIPLTADTVNIPAKPLVTFSLGLDGDGGELSEPDRLMAALIGMSMYQVSGLAAHDRNRVRIAERKAIAAEEAAKPRVSGATVLAPGAQAVPGGIYSPGAPR